MAGAPTAVVEIAWTANPFRGDRFQEHWQPAAEAALKYGASAYALLRSREDQAKFTQLAFFESKLDFERYWYSEEISNARAEAAGLFQIPVLPVWHTVVATGELADVPAEA